ncbi:MAG: amidase family protein, partial [Rickettsiales bacterium]|nr:amidase family protein [Rickettsiales bacterium]
MSELTNLTIKQANEGLRSGQFSSAELVDAHIKAIEASRDMNAYVIEAFESAKEKAVASDAKLKSGDAGLLEGIPVGVKDLFCTKGFRSTSCSHILDGFTPTYESTVTTKLFDSGAVMVGKTNMDEFAMGSANITSYYGEVKNPWRRKDGVEVVPGGSSGGSSAAVAARLCMGALGSDTGGSIRQPAAFTGTVGVKPTYGRCSRFGMIAFASSLDQAGVFTRTVEDAALMLQAICGNDPKDSTSSPKGVPDFSSELLGDVKGLKVGIPKEYIADGMSSEIK